MPTSGSSSISATSTPSDLQANNSTGLTSGGHQSSIIASDVNAGDVSPMSSTFGGRQGRLTESPNHGHSSTMRHTGSKPDMTLSQPRVPQKPQNAELTKRRCGLIKGSRTQIYCGMFFMLLPLVLMVVLLVLVFANIQHRNSGELGFPDTVNSGEDGARDEPVKAGRIYINYSATRLAFVSSLAATLALALVPVALPSLFAYVSATALLRASRASQPRLPTPYQFEVLLRLLEGGTLEIFHFFRYLFDKRRKQTQVVAVVKQAAAMLSLMLMLALGVTIVDALFHIKTISVQYNRIEDYTENNIEGSFSPSRRFPASCWNITHTEFELTACNILPSGAATSQSFSNSSTGYLTIGNQSDINRVVMANDGITSIIVPASQPAGVTFTASSFAASTECETVTKRCRPHNNGKDLSNAQRSFAFDCTPSGAGFLWNGNFSDMFEEQSVYVNYFNNTAMTTIGTTPGSPSSFSNDSVLYNATDGIMRFAVMFGILRDEYVQSDWVDMNGILDGIYYNESRDLIRVSDGWTFGLLKCTTTFSEAVYARDLAGSIHNATLTRMNTSATEPFVQPMAIVDAGMPALDSGVNLVHASAHTSEQVAYDFARLFDRTMLGLSSGVLEAAPPVSAQRTVSSQVAQVPVAELVALVVLNLCYPVIGVVLGVWAMIVCGREGVVRDVQARMGIGAMVAGNFENGKWNESARSVKELYAEMRGEVGVRVGVEESVGVVGTDGGLKRRGIKVNDRASSVRFVGLDEQQN